MTEINIYVGKRLRQRRKQLNLSQDNLAQMLGISSQQIHKYESGLNRISAGMLFTCSKLLHVPITYFYEGIHLNNNTASSHANNHLCCDRQAPLAILLIEDNPVDEMLIRYALEKCNHETILLTIHDGVEALQFLRGKKNFGSFLRPDIILLDLNMPKRSGIEILKEIKHDRELLDIPAIILTNSINPEDMFRSYKIGASGFISKSFDVTEFNKHIIALVDYWSQAMILPSMQYKAG